MACSPAKLIDQALHWSGLAARDLAASSGVAESRISDYRSGRHDPGASRLIELLQSAGLEVRLTANCDRNGLVLGELLDLADALTVGTSTLHEDRLPTFTELTQRHG